MESTPACTAMRGDVAVAMRSHLAAPVMRFLDDGVHLLLRKLRRVDRIGQRQNAPGGHEFDEIRSVFDLIAHRGAALTRAIADSLTWPELLNSPRRRDRRSIAVTTGRADGVGGHQHPRTDHPTVVDGVAQTDIDVIARADVAHGGEACFEGLPRIRRG